MTIDHEIAALRALADRKTKHRTPIFWGTAAFWGQRRAAASTMRAAREAMFRLCGCLGVRPRAEGYVGITGALDSNPTIHATPIMSPAGTMTPHAATAALLGHYQRTLREHRARRKREVYTPDPPVEREWQAAQTLFQMRIKELWDIGARNVYERAARAEDIGIEHLPNGRGFRVTIPVTWRQRTQWLDDWLTLAIPKHRRCVLLDARLLERLSDRDIFAVNIWHVGLPEPEPGRESNRLHRIPPRFAALAHREGSLQGRGYPLVALGVTVDDANHTLDQKIASDTLRRL